MKKVGYTDTVIWKVAVIQKPLYLDCRLRMFCTTDATDEALSPHPPPLFELHNFVIMMS